MVPARAVHYLQCNLQMTNRASDQGGQTPDSDFHPDSILRAYWKDHGYLLLAARDSRTEYME